MPPEATARVAIDAALAAAGWQVQDLARLNLYAGPGVAVREVPLAAGHGTADYLLYADGQAVGVVEAKRAGETLTGVEVQSEKYGTGLPAGVAAPVRPLPFLYQSTGVETRFTNRLDPVPKSRELFTFHRPETLAAWAAAEPLWLPPLGGPFGAAPDPLSERPATFRARLAAMPAVDPTGLWPAQLDAVRRLEASLAAGRPRALVQMATGAGKTIAAVASIYRLLKFGGAKRVLFLVDRGNLGKQALKEFQAYRTPDDGRLFTEIYNVQRLTANRIDDVASVVICTVQRLYSMLRGDAALAEEADEADADAALDAVALGGSDGGGLAALRREPVPVAYNPRYPVELFDVVFVDECHRSIYTLWRQVVEYWDAFLVGLTATPSRLTYGFFDANVVQEYDHERAVADGVNVDFDVYRIRTEITERGSTVEAGQVVDRRDRETRRRRWEQLDEPLVYDASALDRDVVAPDQIRTVVRAFRDRFLPEVFPERTKAIPKTLVFAKDDSHADDLVKILRDELALGNDAVQKITYKTGTARLVERVPGPNGEEVERVTYQSSGVTPDALLQSFRTSFHPRIAVTVDMIATGTDVKPLEVLWFMRTVRSRTLFEQMKGRGVRVVSPDDLKGVTPDAQAKTRFVIVDCVGVSEGPLADTRPMDKQPTVSLDRLLQAVAMGNVDPEVASTLASRLVRLDARLGPAERASVAATTGGPTLRDLARGIVDALDPDRQREAAREAAAAQPARVAEPGWEPSASQVARAGTALLRAALAPVASDPQLRQRLLDLKRSKEQTIDTASVDALLGAGLSPEARDRALGLTTSFEAFLTAHRDELAALRLLYGSRAPGQARLTRAAVEELRRALLARKPPLALDAVWQAYETLDRARVRGGPARLLTDVVALVRFATQRDDALAPLPAVWRARLDAWVARMEAGGRTFSADQRAWLAMMAEHVAANVEIEAEDFDDAPFAQRGGLAGAHRAFGAELPRVLEEVSEVIAA